MHEQGIYYDFSMMALGSNDRVLIGEAKASSYQIFQTVYTPNGLPKDKTTIGLSWGHGMTSTHKDRSHSLLAISWGPLIQIVVLIDHEDRDKPFVIDGFYILRNL